MANTDRSPDALREGQEQLAKIADLIEEAADAFADCEEEAKSRLIQHVQLLRAQLTLMSAVLTLHGHGTPGRAVASDPLEEIPTITHQKLAALRRKHRMGE